MTSTSTDKKTPTLMHAATIRQPRKGTSLLFLRMREPNLFLWSEDLGDGKEQDTPVGAPTIEEAIRLANRRWKSDYFEPLNCGFRYTLPERDEHGINALFYQMMASYSSPNGVYFDAESGGNCFVQFASEEARKIWQKLKKEGRL